MCLSEFRKTIPTTIPATSNDAVASKPTVALSLQIKTKTKENNRSEHQRFPRTESSNREEKGVASLVSPVQRNQAISFFFLFFPLMFRGGRGLCNAVSWHEERRFVIRGILNSASLFAAMETNNPPNPPRLLKRATTTMGGARRHYYGPDALECPRRTALSGDISSTNNGEKQF